jgi:hypothetical protein
MNEALADLLAPQVVGSSAVVDTTDELKTLRLTLARYDNDIELWTRNINDSTEQRTAALAAKALVQAEYNTKIAALVGAVKAVLLAGAS